MTPIERHQRIGMLQAQASAARSVRLSSLFEREPQRVNAFTLEAAGLCLDISRQRLSMAQRLALLDYASAAGVPARRDALLSGAVVNPTEHRPAWHTALRAPAGAGQPAEVAECLQRMTRFASAVRAGEWRGERGQPIRDVICVGIGGSHLGPQLASEALA
ncbi:MAG: glucose-6-phosphate isomerase, partial [Betaproteobacteria bacterium]|nr:glucose-6-phosphate isomerase [Betaproteobacteria bacterium]